MSFRVSPLVLHCALQFIFDFFPLCKYTWTHRPFGHTMVRLRKYLQARANNGEDVASTTPPDWASTRWDGWYDAAAWYARMFVAFSSWLQQESNAPDCPSTITDFQDWLQNNATTVRLHLLFIVEHATEVFDMIQRVQVSVAATFASVDHEKRRPKPTMHRVYNRLHDLHVTLHAVVDSKKLQSNTERRLNRQTATRAAMYDAAAWWRKFLDVVQCACDKLWKYVSKHMELAKQARVLDPTIMAPLPSDINQFPLIFPDNLQSIIVDNGDRDLYRANVHSSTPKFDILQWWEAMKERLPHMYKCACRILAIPHTSCDVERSFSIWKRVQLDKQENMKEGTYKAYVSFCFNGVVPPP